MNTKHRLAADQRGVASLLFSLIMMLVISLIVLSFAQLARRGQREVLDSQLSNQAYYAAESGVNDAVKGINALNAVGDVPATSGCGASSSAFNHAYDTYLYKPLSDSVSYPCASVNPTPTTLVLTNLGTATSKILTMTPVSTIDTITLSWTAATRPTTATLGTCPSTNGPTATDLPKPSAWTCPYGMLRFDLVQTGGPLSRSTLLANTLSVFAVPTRDPAATATISYAAALQQGARVNAKCTVDLCTMKITNVPTNSYALRIIGKYANAGSVTLSAAQAITPNINVAFKSSQAVVDVTGRAQNVLRRLQVRVDLGEQRTGYPDYAIASQGSICKRFSVSIYGTFSDDDPINCPTYEVPAASTTPINAPPGPVAPPIVHTSAYYDCPGGGTFVPIFNLCYETQQATNNAQGFPQVCPAGWDRNFTTCFRYVAATYHPAT